MPQQHHLFGKLDPVHIEDLPGMNMPSIESISLSSSEHLLVLRKTAWLGIASG